MAQLGCATLDELGRHEVWNFQGRKDLVAPELYGRVVLLLGRASHAAASVRSVDLSGCGLGSDACEALGGALALNGVLNERSEVATRWWISIACLWEGCRT